MKSFLYFERRAHAEAGSYGHCQHSAAEDRQGSQLTRTEQPVESLAVSAEPGASHGVPREGKAEHGLSHNSGKHTKGREEKNKTDFKLLLPAPEQMASSHPSHPL